jgi:predicted N-acetyltransferase YhbS
MPDPIETRPERLSDERAIEALQRTTFGPGAYARAAFRVREQAPHERALSFAAEREGQLIGSVRLTPILVGGREGLLLGPLVIDPCCKGTGLGSALMRRALEAAREIGAAFVLLVGDESYYSRFGFRPVPRGSVRMPGPVDPGRVLAVELQPGAAEGLQGMVQGKAR